MRHILLFITLPFVSRFGPVKANILFVIIYGVVLLACSIKYKSAAVRLSSVIAFIVLVFIWLKLYFSTTPPDLNSVLEITYLPAMQIYYGVIIYALSWFIITLVTMIRTQRHHPLQHRAQILVFIFVALIAMAIYYAYHRISNYVIGNQVDSMMKSKSPVQQAENSYPFTRD